MLRNSEKLGYTSPRPYITTKNIQANKLKKKVLYNFEEKLFYFRFIIIHVKILELLILVIHFLANRMIPKINPNILHDGTSIAFSLC